uniref:Uncharacterized protein n=1 Tax=Arundo donax TaxID=35708 RepID=A0A0A9A0F1_ARUDO
MLKETLKTCAKSIDLLDAGLDDKGCAMCEKGLDDALKAVAVYEKLLDDLAKGFGITKGMPLDALEPYRVLFKEMDNLLKSLRQTLKE